MKVQLHVVMYVQISYAKTIIISHSYPQLILGPFEKRKDFFAKITHVTSQESWCRYTKLQTNLF